jgi:SpoVK/Ycf46/Vps4 family AAA+-type ATPase
MRYNYKEFISELDNKKNIKTENKEYINTENKKEKKSKEGKDYVDDLLQTCNSKYDNEMRFTTVLNHNYIDPNKFSENISIESLLRKKIRVRCSFPDKIPKPASPSIKKVDINVEITNIDDLLKLIKTYPLDDAIEYNINMKGLHKIHSSLQELNSMIGMKELKENIVDQILYFIQNLHKSGSGDFMHTVIYGPPGTGKTEIAKIIGQIFSKLGVLTKGSFRKVTRSDLIAGYLGQTAIKTRDVINDCLGGVLFIDEAYALGNSEKRDSFSKECIDTLCEALSNHKEDLMVIIAGYENELKECFFNYNQGLDSRFTWRFKTEEYKGEALYNIFLKKVNDCKWKIDVDSGDKKITADWFEKHIPYFKFFGRDMETLLAKIKIVHGRRVFCRPIEEKMMITFQDLEKGFEMYLKNDEVKKRKDGENMNYILKTMYV